MPKYRATGVVSGSKYLGIVEADTEAAAKEAALELDSAGVYLCYQCGNECSDGEIIDVVLTEILEDEVG